MSVTTRVVKHVNVPLLFGRVKRESIKAAVELGVERARAYVAIDTGSLQSSIEQLTPNSYGVDGATLAARNHRDYSGYQEGIWPTYTRYTPYLKPSAADVARAMPGIVWDAFRGRYR